MHSALNRQQLDPGDDPGPGGLAADHDRISRALLSHLGGATHPVLAALLAHMTPGDALACIRSGALPADVPSRLAAWPLGLTVMRRLRGQLAALPADGGIAAAAAAGIRLIRPGDHEWPFRLDDLDAAKPYALWVCGTRDLGACCAQAVAVVGSRAATAYGAHVAGQIAGELATQGRTVVSGAAYGIDAAAHQAAMAAGGRTVAVLACGVDVAYPRGHAEMLAQIASQGLIVSEYAPGSRPERRLFLARNRIIAALAEGLVVVEAGPRSGALNAAEHAEQLARPVMAVPGPVTSAASAGCHHLIAGGGVRLVTCAADILTHLDH